MVVLLCTLDFYEINDLTLLIPALKFEDLTVRKYSRYTYLLVVFAEFVVGMPIIEQRFIFIFLGNSIDNLKTIKNTFRWLHFERGSVINQAALIGVHYFTYITVTFKSFGENYLQLFTVQIVIWIFLIIIHRTRTKYGIAASITAHMVFNFSLFIFLYFIYFSDSLHKGYTAEEFTTTNKNCIDFVFGHNEGFEDNK